MQKNKQNLKEYRSEIDAIDTIISAMLEKRFSITDKVGKLKKEQGLPIFDRSREDEIIAKQKTEENKEIFNLILDLSKKRMK